LTEKLDLTGLSCPMPVVKTQLAMDKLKAGDLLEVFATDRGALSDIPSWASATGNDMVETDDQGSRLRFVIRKGGASPVPPEHPPPDTPEAAGP